MFIKSSLKYIPSSQYKSGPIGAGEWVPMLALSVETADPLLAWQAMSLRWIPLFSVSPEFYVHHLYFSFLPIIVSPCLNMVLYMYITIMLCAIAHPYVVQRRLTYHYKLMQVCGVVPVYKNFNVTDSPIPRLFFQCIKTPMVRNDVQFYRLIPNPCFMPNTLFPKFSKPIK